MSAASILPLGLIPRPLQSSNSYSAFVSRPTTTTTQSAPSTSTASMAPFLPLRPLLVLPPPLPKPSDPTQDVSPKSVTSQLSLDKVPLHIRFGRPSLREPLPQDRPLTQFGSQGGRAVNYPTAASRRSYDEKVSKLFISFSLYKFIIFIKFNYLFTILFRQLISYPFARKFET